MTTTENTNRDEQYEILRKATDVVLSNISYEALQQFARMIVLDYSDNVGAPEDGEKWAETLHLIYPGVSKESILAMISTAYAIHSIQIPFGGTEVDQVTLQTVHEILEEG